MKQLESRDYKSLYDIFEEMKQLESRNYKSLYDILRAYRSSGTRNDVITGEFNRFDTPSTYYFRIFFDFHKGLLNTDEVNQDDLSTSNLFSSNRRTIGNSALNYLLLNNEWERADMLKDFINLLSNISVNSPWYFNEIGGLGELLNRSEFSESAYSVPESKSITIKCIPDAHDDRIGTLLDLYRSAGFSWQLHKEIIPANLRRFDMYIYIFSAPIRGMHELHRVDKSDKSIVFGNRNIFKDKKVTRSATKVDLMERKIPEEFASFDQDDLQVNKTTGAVSKRGSHYLTSSKLIQLMDCEIDLNSSASAYETINNSDGFEMNYSIPIKVNMVMEQRFNEVLLKRIGDFVVGDMDLDTSNLGENGENLMVHYGDEASEILTVTNSDDRISKDRLQYGLVEPDTWEKRDNVIQETGDIMGQAEQIYQSARSTIESWTDIDRLGKSLDAGARQVFHRVLWGNIFETNLQDITSNISSNISGMSSDSVINQITNGWTHTTTNRGGNPGSSLNKSIFQR